MAWYVLFVKTGYEDYMAQQISRTWQINGLKPFVPVYDSYFKKGGKLLPEKKRCVPGYVFIESDISGIDFYIATKPFINSFKNSFKLLRYGDGNLDQSFEMREEERDIIEKLLNSERCIEISKGIIEGCNVTIREGPLVGLEGFIRRVYRHKREAVVEFEMMGAKREVVVGLEIVKKSS